MKQTLAKDDPVNTSGWPALKLGARRGLFLAPLLPVLLMPVLPGPVAAEVANPTGVAVIIGNADYQHRDVPPVDFAHRDAEAFRRYVVDVLGYDPANVIDLPDASRRELIDVFGTRTAPEGLLWSYLDPAGGSDVVVFYSGHGVPGTDDGRGYLLPVDADPNAAADDGYPIDLLYRNVGGLKEARSVRVYLDACFSGGSHTGRSLIQNASPVYVSATLPEEVAGKVTGLAAASGEQVASWDEAVGHGLFTHHLLDALYGGGDADGDGAVTAEEAKAYLDRHMTRAARRQHRRVQRASLLGAADAVLASAGDGGTFPARTELAGTAPGDPPPAASTAGPSLTVEQDKYLLGLKMAFEAKDYPRVLEFAGRLEALGGGLPAEVEFFRGEAAFQAGRFADAAGSLERYVAAANRDDPDYRRVLELLLALEVADDEAYARAEAGGTSASFGEYLELFPGGRHVEEARERESALQAEEAERRRLAEEHRAAERRADDAAFAEAKRLDTPSGYQAYLDRGGRHAAAAEALLAEVGALDAGVEPGHHVLFSEDFESHEPGSRPAHYIIVHDGLGASEQRVETEGRNRHLRTAGQRSWSLHMREDFEFDLPAALSVSWRMRVDVDQDRYEYTLPDGTPYAHLGNFSIKNADEQSAAIAVYKYESDGRIVAACPRDKARTHEVQLGAWNEFRLEIDFAEARQRGFVNGEALCDSTTMLVDLSGRWNSWGEAPGIRFDSGNHGLSITRYDDIVIRAIGEER